ncbi:MAG: phosphatidate cytidylyltransferase, partial [Promethearchaeota archaeon]
YFKSIGALQEFGVTGISAGRGINILIYWGFSYMMTLQDAFRMRAFHCLPGWGRTGLKASLEQKEQYNFVASVPLMLGFVPFIISPFPVYFTVIFVAAVSDAATSTFGRKFGKHVIPRLERKTWEGLIAGIVTAFSCTFTISCIFNPGSLALVLLYSALIAGTFGLLDGINEKIDDNFVNTLVLGPLIWILYVIAFG